jgi:hypothetical protein
MFYTCLNVSSAFFSTKNSCMVVTWMLHVFHQVSLKRNKFQIYFVYLKTNKMK